MTVMCFGLPGHHESSIEDEGRLAVEAFGPPVRCRVLRDRSKPLKSPASRGPCSPAGTEGHHLAVPAGRGTVTKPKTRAEPPSSRAGSSICWLARRPLEPPVPRGHSWT